MLSRLVTGAVRVDRNNLDLSEGSEDLENIRQLEVRGVVVRY